MPYSTNKELILGIMVGTAGISLLLLWYHKVRKPGIAMKLPEFLSLGNTFNSITLQDEIHDDQGTTVIFQERQLQILEKLNELLTNMEELKEEIRFLKEAIPKLEEYIQDELGVKITVHKISPQHRARKRRLPTIQSSATSNSSEEAESEGGYAVLCGYVSEFEGLQNKINYGHLFKEHLDIAIKLLPEEPFLYYLKGRYCYTVSKLSWIEKKMAATLFGKIPSSTVQEALHNFLKAEELCPGYSNPNYMYLAKCYTDLEENQNALKFCNLALLLPTVTKEGTLSSSHCYLILGVSVIWSLEPRFIGVSSFTFPEFEITVFLLFMWTFLDPRKVISDPEKHFFFKKGISVSKTV
ncbi:regulator of microtubule dynamics protein 2 isoform X12 [Pongo abelii]|uniref:regulator of microtubule dynamics protein 2 isoform X12 n=1 Tax=Pongo abelii TaxID=9601 RepID=UPI0023E79EAE|nr:regulator of microtubule dynamics protein 2 isoform X9 [Pongo abelii]